MIQIQKYKYNPEKIEKLYNHIKTYWDKGMPIDYRVVVDGVEAVKRTSDPEMFELYENLIDEDTKKVEVIIYSGSSQHCTKHIFFLGDNVEEKLQDNKGLNGLEIEGIVQDAIYKERQANQMEMQRRDKEALESKVQELEEEIEAWEEENEELKAKIKEMEDKKNPTLGFLGEYLPQVLEGFVKGNPRLLKKLPGGQALAGLFTEDESHAELPEGRDSEGEVSFKPKNEPTQLLSDQDRQAIGFMKAMQNAFAPDEFQKVHEILIYLGMQKERIDEILGLLSEEKQDDGN